MARQRQLHPPVAAERGIMLTIGVPAGEKGDKQVKRAVETLAAAGFRVGLTSDETIVQAAREITSAAE
jgi:uncharacterized protein YqgV (UPF0045/DUF77 family)